MDVEPPLSRDEGSRSGGGGAGGGGAQPAPRLPSISALLNAVPSDRAPDSSSISPTQTLPPCNSFDRPSRHGSLSTTVSSAGTSPGTSFSSQPSSSEFPSVATAAPRIAEETAFADSQWRSPHDIPSPRSKQLTSAEFPDGNALYPLPSGLSSNAAISSRAAYGTLSPRPRSNSISYPLVYEPPSFARAPHPYSGFATSSERAGATGGDERGPHASVRERAPEGGLLRQTGQRISPNRQRALSISTADEYRLHPPAWPTVSPVEQQQQHALHQPASRRESTDSRRSAAPPRLAYVMEQPPDLLPVPPPLAGPSTWSGGFAAVPLPLNHEMPLPPLSHASLPSSSRSKHPPPPAGLGLHPLSIPNGLPHPSSASPPSAMSPQNGHPPLRSVAGSSTPSALPNGTGAFPPTLGWNALPARPGPPPSGQIAADLAYGAEAVPETVNEAGKYACPHCSKRFARPSSLRIHMHSHTGEKPFSCHLCDRAFSVQSNLRRHLKIHRGGAQPVAPSRRGSRLAAEQQARAANAEAEQAAQQSVGVVDPEGIPPPGVGRRHAEDDEEPDGEDGEEG
ncbi:hypothetical protein JCM10213_001139 [Rhodosporidiobolus nylandii]